LKSKDYSDLSKKDKKYSIPFPLTTTIRTVESIKQKRLFSHNLRLKTMANIAADRH